MRTALAIVVLLAASPCCGADIYASLLNYAKAQSAVSAASPAPRVAKPAPAASQKGQPAETWPPQGYKTCEFCDGKGKAPRLPWSFEIGGCGTCYGSGVLPNRGFYYGNETPPTRPTAPAKPAETPKAPLYPSRSASGRSWTYNGSTSIPASHLIESHGLDPAIARAMTPAQRRAYHADAHEGAVRRNYSATPKSSCPGGVCPSSGSFTHRQPLINFRPFRR